MDNSRDMEASGRFEARYLAFLETITQLRPRLHRYCSRMTGSVLDGEDVVQDALFEAYRKLDQYDCDRVEPFLFNQTRRDKHARGKIARTVRCFSNQHERAIANPSEKSVVIVGTERKR